MPRGGKNKEKSTKDRYHGRLLGIMRNAKNRMASIRGKPMKNAIA